jgi:hypothetical protein
MAEHPGTATGSGAGTRRGRTIQGQWTSAVLENIYECTSRDSDELEVWCYTDRLSYAPGDTVQFHVTTTVAEFDLEIIRDGVTPEIVHRADGLAGTMHPTPIDCSVNGCGWPVAYEFTLPDDWRSGVYIVRSYAHREGEVFDHRHMFILRPAKPGRDARMVMVCATGTWMAYNEWGGSNHYEGITGPNNDEFSTRLSIHRPWSRGFVWLPKGAPRIALAQTPAQNATVRYPHMEWSYTNGYSKKYASAGWASYERNFAVWAEEQGYALDIIAQHDLPDDPDVLKAYDCAVFIGHDEYWSWEMRDTVDAYVEGGGKAARFAGNFMWQTRLEDDGATQVCHKYDAREKDPLRETERSTTSWEAPEVGRPGALTFGLNASQGVYTRYGLCCPRAPGGFTVYRPEHWSLEGSDLYYGDVFGGESTIFGYEVDGLDYTFRHGLPYPTGDDGAPGGIEIIAMGLATLVEDNHGHEGVVQFLEDLDARFIAETMYYEATGETIDRVKRGSGMMVTMPKGKGEVFHAGTANWVAGLIDHDPFVERITRNVLDHYLAS